MSLSPELIERCESKCELCSTQTELNEYIVPPKTGDRLDEQIAVCSVCLEQIENDNKIDKNHWRCLNDSIWNPAPSVQVMAYRMLQKLSDEGWVQDLLGMIYMEEGTLEWAQMDAIDNSLVHKDSNGVILQNGDSVVIIKDLNVKGSSLVAKRGTAVRRIRLDPNNANHIEGKVDGQHIVILTQYVKK